jgi:hypothetical protein
VDRYIGECSCLTMPMNTADWYYDMSMQDEVLAYNQVNAAIDAYLSAENFAALPDAVSTIDQWLLLTV